jgi:phosphoribulokinase
MLLLRPTIEHPDLSYVLTDDVRSAMHLKLTRDEGKPVDALHIHAYGDARMTADVEQAIWGRLDVQERLPPVLGMFEDGRHDEPMALTQLILLYHLLAARSGRRSLASVGASAWDAKRLARTFDESQKHPARR